MSIYNQIARGFNPGEGLVKARAYEIGQEQNKLANAFKERQLGLQEQGFALKQQEAVAKMDEQQRKVAKEKTGEMLKALAWSDSPEKLAQARDYYAAQGAEMPPYLQQVTPENFHEVRKRALQDVMPLKDMLDRMQPKYEYKNVGTGNPGETQLYAMNPYDPSQRQPVGGVKRSKKDGTYIELPDGTVVATGDVGDIKGARQPLTKKSLNDQQDKLLQAEADWQELSKLKKDFASKYMTASGRAKHAANSTLDYVGLAWDKEFLSDAEKFFVGVEQFFNQYRQQITGAAAADKELERLRKAFINRDLPPTVFTARLDALMGKIERDVKRKSKNIRSGVNVSGKPEDLSPAEQSRYEQLKAELGL